LLGRHCQVGDRKTKREGERGNGVE
jgi:hypothetical protein